MRHLLRYLAAGAGLALASLSSHGFAADETVLRADAARMAARIEALSAFGANPEGGVSRVAYSDADIDARDYIVSIMRDAGLTVRVDAAGNIIGRREGSEPGLPPVMFGSHIDSVPGGGNYDGDVGVIGAIEVAQVLHENGVATRHPLEVVSFTDEEGGLIGSLAMTKGLRASTLDVRSHSGYTIREGIRRVGGNPDELDRPLRQPGDLAAFIELHIEQGAILDETGVDIGIVEGIVGIQWWDVIVEGFANHAGTTPMDRRADALVTAADLVLEINRIARETPGRQVATVGRIRAEPGAPNVIPGRVVMSLEIRDLEAQKIRSVFHDIEAAAQRLAERRRTPVRFEPIDVASEPAPTDPGVRSVIASAARGLGLSTALMPSGAGHDAQDMTRIAPTGMIFVPSVDGVSHSPVEFTKPEHMANGASVLLHTVLAIDRGGLR